MGKKNAILRCPECQYETMAHHSDPRSCPECGTQMRTFPIGGRRAPFPNDPRNADHPINRTRPPTGRDMRPV